MNSKSEGILGEKSVMGVWSILAEQEQQLLGVKLLQCHSVENNSSFRLSVFFEKKKYKSISIQQNIYSQQLLQKYF